jgi:hypothetical protein
MVKLFKIMALLCVICTRVLAESANDPCTGLLNIANRPSNIDSPCTVPQHKFVAELTYQNQELTNHIGSQQNGPDALLRLGLPANNEFFIILPNYISQSNIVASGFTETFAGFKHQFPVWDKWLLALETVINLPDGSAAYGSKGYGAAFNGILNYTLNAEWNVSFMLGASTATDPRLVGGQRFNSLNPDLVLSYSPTEKITLYSEIYGQSKTGAMQKSGFIIDAGISYLLNPNLVINGSLGQRTNGSLQGLAHYVGAGVSIML